MEGIHTLKDLLRQRDWLAKIDLKAIISPVGIYENSKTSTSHSPRERCTANSLYRRHMVQLKGNVASARE